MVSLTTKISSFILSGAVNVEDTTSMGSIGFLSKGVILFSARTKVLMAMADFESNDEITWAWAIFFFLTSLKSVAASRFISSADCLFALACCFNFWAEAMYSSLFCWSVSVNALLKNSLAFIVCCSKSSL